MLPARLDAGKFARAARAAPRQWSRRSAPAPAPSDLPAAPARPRCRAMPGRRVMTRYGQPSRSPSNRISGIGKLSRPRNCASEPRSETNWSRSIGGKIFRISSSPRPTTRLVPVRENMRRSRFQDHGRARCRAPPAAIATRFGAPGAGTFRQSSKLGSGYRSSVRIGALELAQQAVAALDGKIHRGLRGPLAAEHLLQLLVDHVADQDEGAKPDSLRVLGRRLQRRSARSKSRCRDCDRKNPARG